MAKISRRIWCRNRIKNLAIPGSRNGALSCSLSVGLTLGAVEKELIQLTLGSVNGNKKQAASVLGISRRALYNKMATDIICS